MYASPASTWKEYRAALIAHDRERARHCLASAALNAESILSLTDAELTKAGESLSEEIHVAKENMGTDMVEAYATSQKADGSRHAGSIEFVWVNGNWLINGI